MKKVLIIGGGLAGCAVANELSKAGICSCIVEKDSRIGGKARSYGCKSDDRCNNCGLCAVGNLWQDVECDPNIEKLTNASVADISVMKGGFSALIDSKAGKSFLDADRIVVATGFENPAVSTEGKYGCVTNSRVYSGNALENLLKERGSDAILPDAPKSMAFILCAGSRSLKERAAYCSQVCCAYATRSAKVMKHCYPDAEVVVFYMDIQAVNAGNYMKELSDKGIILERCRPSSVGFDNGYPVVSYEDSDGKKNRKFDYVFLATGVHPDIAQNNAVADISGLKLNSEGFLDYVKSPYETGVYLAGCASKPMDIPAVLSDAKNAAAALIRSVKEACAS